MKPSLLACLCVLGLALPVPLKAQPSLAYPDLVYPVVAPNPAPSAPGDSFNPPIVPQLPAAACAPAIAEWTRQAGPGASLVLTGDTFSNYGGQELGQDTAFWVYGQTSGGDATITAATIQRLGQAQDRVLLTLPAWLPNSTFLIWPQNSAGLGAPVAVNQTDLWWLGPSTAGPGDTVSAFGRNFFFNNVVPAVYVGPPGGPFTQAALVAYNPYKIDFQVPPGLAPGASYQVWVHNGHGGAYGWSGPQSLAVAADPAWTGPTIDVTQAPYNADPTGAADSYPAIAAALAQAQAFVQSDGNATLYFPAGTYSMSQGLEPSSNIRWMGAGMGSTTLTAMSGFGSCCLFTPNGTGTTVNNAEIDALSLSAGPAYGNNLLKTGGINDEVASLRYYLNLRCNQAAFVAVGGIALDISNAQGASLNNCLFIGGTNTASTLFSSYASQVFINGCAFYGTDDAGGLMVLNAVQGLSVTNCTGQDWNNSNASSGLGWDSGRFLYGNTALNSERDIYAGGNATYQLAVRPGALGSNFQINSNEGEQYLWEGNYTMASGSPAPGTGPSTLALAGLSGVMQASDVGFWEVAVVSGPGLGQHRLITGWDGANTVSVSPPWQLVPQASSGVIVARDLDKCVLYQNAIQGKANYATFSSSSVGVEPYGNSYDFVADGNVIQQVRTGILSFCLGETNADLGSIDPAFFNLYQNNSVSASLVGADSVLADWNPAWTNNPGCGYVGNVFRNNLFDFTPIAYEMVLTNADIPGTPMDANIFEGNTVLNSATGVNCVIQPGELGSTLFYGNQFNACTCSATVAGSQGIAFSSGQSPALQGNTWLDYQTVYAASAGSSLPGPVLEAPQRVGRVQAFPSSGSFVVQNSGTAPQACALSSLASWLSVSPTSGLVPNEGAFTFVYSATAPPQPGLESGQIRVALGAAEGSPLDLQVYYNPDAAQAGQDYCAPATPTSGNPDPGSGSTYIFPSPARGETAQVAYHLSGPGHARILVYNETAHLVDKVEDDKPAGSQTSVLSVGRWAPGVYYYLCILTPTGSPSQTLPAGKFAVIH